MKLNWAERWVVNNPLRVMQQRLEILWFLKKMPLAPGVRILEFGCGRGAGARLIVEKFQPSVLFAQDLDLEMILRAKKYLKNQELEKISLSVGDTYELPFKNGSIDAVFGFGVLHHIPDWQSALRAITRVLKTGGVYFIEELYPQLYQNCVTKHILLHPTENRFKSPEFKKAMKQLNLEVKHNLEIEFMGLLCIAQKSK